MSLTNNGVKQLLSAVGGVNVPIYVQILHFQRFVPDAAYKSTLQTTISITIKTTVEAFDAWISDGKVQEKCTIHPKYNNLFTSGELTKYSIIKIIKSRIIFKDNVLGGHRMLVVEEMKLVDRSIAGTIHSSTASNASNEPSKYTSHPSLWTDPSIKFATPKLRVLDQSNARDKDKDKDKDKSKDYESTPLVGNRMYYVSHFCDDPVGPQYFLPPPPHVNEDEDQGESGGESERDGTSNKRKRSKSPNSPKSPKSTKYNLELLFEKDIVAPDDYVLSPNLALGSVSMNPKAPKKKKGQKGKSERPPLVGIITSKTSIFSYGGSSDMGYPMKFEFTLTDSTGSVKVVMWNSMCKYFHILDIGQVIAIHGYMVKKAYEADGFEIAANPSHPKTTIYKLKREHFAHIVMPKLAYHFVPFNTCTDIPSGYRIDCIGMITSRSASERRRITSLPTPSYYHYVWLTLLNPPSTASSGEDFAVRVGSGSQTEIFASLAVGQIVAITDIILHSITVDSKHPRSTYGYTSPSSIIYQVEGPYSNYTPPSILKLPEVQECVEWFGMGEWDNSMELIEEYTPHYIWCPSLSMYSQKFLDNVLLLNSFQDIDDTRATLLLKERRNLLIQCLVLGMQETSQNSTSLFTLQLQDINRQYEPLLVSIPPSILQSSSTFYHLSHPSNPLLQLQYFLLGSEGDELADSQELTDTLSDKVFVCGLELYCGDWKDIAVELTCAYLSNT